jgi:hypothetical protein
MIHKYYTNREIKWEVNGYNIGAKRREKGLRRTKAG